MIKTTLILLVFYLTILLIFKYINSTGHKDYTIKLRPFINDTQTMNQDVCVLGGGLSGLLVSSKIMTKHNVVLFEKSDRLGGNNYSSDENIPIRFGVFLKWHSPCLFRTLRDLNLDYTSTNLTHLVSNYGDTEHIFPVQSHKGRLIIDGKFDFKMFKHLIVLIYNLITVFLLYFFSDYYSHNSTVGSFNLNDIIFKHIVIPVGGINMFVDNKDFTKLSSKVVARYVLLGLTDGFVAVKGGNHLLIDSLVNKIESHVKINTHQSINSVKILHNKKILVNSSQIFDSIVITCQPHDAKNIIPHNLEPHNSILDCFETVNCYSCIHTYDKVFKKYNVNTNLVYDTIGPHHYLHIDAHYYNMDNHIGSRQRFITYYYDDAPNIIPEKYIVKKSFTKLSRQIAEKKNILDKLLSELKENTQNIYLSNAAYYGFMWHEDACIMAETVAKAFY